MKLPNSTKELSYWKKGYQYVAGIDEVGRGCLAGPVVAAAVMFDQTCRKVRGVNDSKKLSRMQREMLSPKILRTAKFFGIGLSTVEEINTIGINPAIFLAMERALLQLKTPSLNVILVDGSMQPVFKNITPDQIETIIKGDQISYSIAAASIIAKVYRDQLMDELSKLFPMYRWEKNVGYGTEDHREGIRKHGLCEHHRKLFCRKTLHNIIG